MSTSILIACIGNIFLGDDAFGVEVSRSLMRRRLPSEVTVRDYGIRGFDLAYSLLDPWGTVVLVDALARDGIPGTLLLMQPDLRQLGRTGTKEMNLVTHSMDPMRVLDLAQSIGPVLAQVLVVGCVPEDFGDELEGRIGLSACVQNAVEEACNMIQDLVTKILFKDSAREQIGEVTA